MSAAEVMRKAPPRDGRRKVCAAEVAGLAALAICCVVRSTRLLLKKGFGHPWQGPLAASRSMLAGCLPVRTTGKRDTEAPR